MLRLASFDIVFREVPNEVTLAINISGCNNACKGCHSPHLATGTGHELTESLLLGLLNTYASSITCVCFMGGDDEPLAIGSLCGIVKREAGHHLKTAWYSGKNHVPGGFPIHHTDYIKLGPYIEELGGLTSPLTNQRFFRIANGQMEDISGSFVGEARNSPPQ